MSVAPSPLSYPLHLLRLSSSLMYQPSKAQQIMSRYRPIAPKPAPPDRPAPHLDSLASATTTATLGKQHRRSRKRRSSSCASGGSAKFARKHSDGASSVAAVPAISAAPSNTAGASSLTQGNSDAAVPLRPTDLMWTSPGASSSAAMAADDTLEASDSSRIATSAERSSCHEQLQPKHHLDVRWSGGAASSSAHGYGAQTPSQYLAIPAAKLIPLQPPQPPPPHHFSPSTVHRLGGAALFPCSSTSSPSALAFIDRASAPTPAERSPPPPPASSVQNSKGAGPSSIHGVAGGFTEMIRGIMRLPTAADVQSLMQVRTTPTAATTLQEAAFCNISRNSVLQQSRETDASAAAVQIVPQYSSSGGAKRTLPPAKGASPVGKPEAEEDSSRLVTLNLLPDMPLKSLAAEAEVLPIEFLAREGSKWRTAPSDLSSSYFSAKTLQNIASGGGRGGMQMSDSPPSSSCYAAAASATLIPQGLDRTELPDQLQVYGASADPVVLLDEREQVMWFNKAYERALKSASERSVGDSTTGPYIDPLGHPTPLCSFNLPSSTTPSKSGGGGGAILWGFLKKLVIQEPVRAAADCSSGVDYSRTGLCLGEASPANPVQMDYGSSAMMAAMVIGEPSRLTTVTLEKVMEVDMETAVMVKAVEEVEEELGEGKEPALITEWGSNRVRWMNEAFKEMVGGGAELTFLCGAERIPASALAFCGCVNLEWFKGGKRRSMTVPSDVLLLLDGGLPEGGRRKMWVWRFDVAVSLSLNSPPAF